MGAQHEAAPWYPSAAWKLEVVPRFLANLLRSDLKAKKCSSVVITTFNQKSLLKILFGNRLFTSDVSWFSLAPP